MQFRLVFRSSTDIGGVGAAKNDILAVLASLYHALLDETERVNKVSIRTIRDYEPFSFIYSGT